MITQHKRIELYLNFFVVLKLIVLFMRLDKNKIYLKPRFKLQVKLSQKSVLSKFRDMMIEYDNKYISKVVSNHIVFDIPKDENKFWSPQLHLEVLDDVNNSSILKGLFSPKAHIWSFFMFLHFLLGTAFFFFLIIAYTKYNLHKDYSLYLILCLITPIIWILLYILGQLGKRKGHGQMEEIFNFLMKTLNE